MSWTRSLTRKRTRRWHAWISSTEVNSRHQKLLHTIIYDSFIHRNKNNKKNPPPSLLTNAHFILLCECMCVCVCVSTNTCVVGMKALSDFNVEEGTSHDNVGLRVEVYGHKVYWMFVGEWGVMTSDSFDSTQIHRGVLRRARWCSGRVLILVRVFVYCSTTI